MSWLPTRASPSSEYDRLFATAMARLPGIGMDMLSAEVGNAMQEFCRETVAWREGMLINLLADIATYSLAPSENCALVTHVIAVKVDDRYYRPLGPDVGLSTSFSTYKVSDSYQEITLYPVPGGDKAKALDVVVGLTLRVDSLDLPDALISAYFEPLIDGVLERAFAHHAKPYTNPERADYHHKRFRAAITRTRRIVRGGDAQATPPWQFHTQAPGRPRRGARSYGW